MTLSLQELAQQEPWRRNFGIPRNAIDPAWEPSAFDTPCDADVEFDGSGWWICKRCGYIGLGSAMWHRPPQHPIPFLINGIFSFMAKSLKKNPPDLSTVLHQMLYVAGVAIRYAAVQPPAQLGPYVDRMVTA